MSARLSVALALFLLPATAGPRPMCSCSTPTDPEKDSTIPLRPRRWAAIPEPRSVCNGNSLSFARLRSGEPRSQAPRRSESWGFSTRSPAPRHQWYWVPPVPSTSSGISRRRPDFRG